MMKKASASHFKLDEIELVIKRALEKRRLQMELRSLQEKLQKRDQFANIIGNSPPMREVFELVQKAAPTDSTVLICGESGTGKELIAEVIHTLSKRKDKPLIKLNCVAIPETLLESELFGHEKGSFTGAIVQKPGKFELADQGTIFLDEIGDMSQETQAKVLRALQEKEFERVGGKKPIKVDVRIIAATNKNLLEAIQERQFREDLYFRLNVISIQLPSLRERREDIPLLAEHFLLQANDNLGKKISGFSKEVIRFFMDYHWPGNVRELKNCIERAAVVVEGEVITLECMPPYMQELIKMQKFEIPDSSSLDAVVKAVERQVILDTLRKTSGVQSEAAKILGITERSLWHRVKKLGIDIKQIKK
jgi:two-component system response regulator AtoC